MSKETIVVEMEANQHLRIKTPHGVISYYSGEHWKPLTAYVKDVYFTGFYTTKTKKKTHRCGRYDQPSQVIVEVKE